MNRYKKYKDSGVEWIGEIPEEWAVRKLKYSVLKVGSGITPKGGANVYQLFGVPLLRSQNIHFDGLKLDDVAYIDKETHDTMVNSKVLPGDVLLNITGASIGRCFYVDDLLGEANVNQHVCIIRPKEGLNTKYLYFIIMSDIGQNQIDFEQTGSGREGLNFEALNNFIIPQIKLEEQILLSHYLSRKTVELDKLISQKEWLIELYEEEKTAIINQAVIKGIDPDIKFKDSGVEWLGEIPEGWEVKKARYLFQIKKRIAGELGYDVLSITQKGIKTKDIESNEGQIASDYSKYQIVEPGDFAMNHMDLLTGFVDIAIQIGVTSPDYRVFSLKKKSASSRYYLYLFQMGYKRKIFYGYGRGAAMFGRWRFPTEEFNSFEFPVPPLKDQTAIVRYIETEAARIDAKIAKTRRIIELQKEYRTALISEVVTGKIKITEETIP